MWFAQPWSEFYQANEAVINQFLRHSYFLDATGDVFALGQPPIARVAKGFFDRRDGEARYCHGDVPLYKHTPFREGMDYAALRLPGWIERLIREHAHACELTPKPLLDFVGHVPCHTVFCENGLGLWDASKKQAVEGTYYSRRLTAPHLFPVIAVNAALPSEAVQTNFHERGHHMAHALGFVERAAFQAVIATHPELESFFKHRSYERTRYGSESHAFAIEDFYAASREFFFQPVIAYQLQVVYSVAAEIGRLIVQSGLEGAQIAPGDYARITREAAPMFDALEAHFDPGMDIEQARYTMFKANSPIDVVMLKLFGAHGRALFEGIDAMEIELITPSPQR
ncbi:MAG: hypothetical protein J0L97_06320 [Alphaproteobacteria bacterium]|nr:hypothetical protein [Alphaproteobacteria bacterium]